MQRTRKDAPTNLIVKCSDCGAQHVDLIALDDEAFCINCIWADRTGEDQPEGDDVLDRTETKRLGRKQDRIRANAVRA